ncbi:MAG: hypothetical protein HQL37_06970 [Alphaproteobacteria bacterium]|nr:hypothetical protein [Alphaproteobacteria bacterium]
MTPAAAIAALDRALAANGEPVRLQRITGSQQTAFECACRAKVSSYQPVELIAGITQTDVRLIIGPTEINRAQWTGSAPPGQDRRLPLISIDRVFVRGKTRTVAACNPFYLDGELVRIELRVTG